MVLYKREIVRREIMIDLMGGLPDNVLGFSAKGKVTADDYENVVIPAVEKKLERHEKIRCLYHIGEEFEGYEAGAMWDDAKVGLGHFAAWEKIAIVTDVEWLRVTGKVFGFAMPGQVRIFHNSELKSAIDWVSE